MPSHGDLQHTVRTETAKVTMPQTLVALISVILIPAGGWAGTPPEPSRTGQLEWQQLGSLPDELGVAGPFAGVHNDALIIAGGANFPRPVWQNDKVWHDRIFVLARTGDGYRGVMAEAAEPIGLRCGRFDPRGRRLYGRQ